MLKKLSLVTCTLLALTALVTAQAQKDQAQKSIKFTVLLPQDDATLTIARKAAVGEGEKRTLTAKAAPGKDEVLVIAVWEPNNYTKITRPRKVKYKEGENTIDFRQPSSTEKDDIVVRFVPTPQEFV